MKRIALIFAVVALTTAQNPRKIGKHGKQGSYLASSPGGSGPSNAGDYGPSQYESPAPYSNQGQQKTHYGGPSNHNDKPAYSQLLADTRTLNHDGTINFNFQADNGLQQGESVDPDGTRRGFYSYPGADGKPITVKYTAGKNGFIAEGDHLPLQPQAAAHSDRDESAEYSPKQHKRPRQESNGEGHDNGQYNPEYHGGASGGQYRPQEYSRQSAPAPAPVRYNYSPSSSGGRSQGGPGPSPQHRPNSYSSPSYSSGNEGGSSFVGFGGDYQTGFASPQTSHNNYAAPARAHNSGAGRPSGPSGGSPNYGGPSFGASSHRGGFTAANPYQPSGAGPYNGKFDLGNNGHFSIDFNPGQGQEYRPEGSPSTTSYSRPRPGPPGRGPSGSRGQY